jgi:hypothetical protein
MGAGVHQRMIGIGAGILRYLPRLLPWQSVFIDQDPHQLHLSLFEKLLPRHLQIIFEINHRFLEEVARRWPDKPQGNDG